MLEEEDFAEEEEGEAGASEAAVDFGALPDFDDEDDEEVDFDDDDPDFEDEREEVDFDELADFEDELRELLASSLCATAVSNPAGSSSRGICFCTSRSTASSSFSSRLEQMVMALPVRPARPVRPMR